MSILRRDDLLSLTQMVVQSFKQDLDNVTAERDALRVELAAEKENVRVARESLYALAEQRNALQAERGAMRAAVDRVRTLPGYLMFGQPDLPANVCVRADDIIAALGEV